MTEKLLTGNFQISTNGGKITENISSYHICFMSKHWPMREIIVLDQAFCLYMYVSS